MPKCTKSLFRPNLLAKFKEIFSVELDNCEVCHGARGGIKGNENIIDGVITCDYCHVRGDKPKPK